MVEATVTEAPAIMGILNVTEDSFADGGAFLETESAIAHGLELFAAGCTVVDVGGESSRPGASVVDASIEEARVVPVIAALSSHGVVSVDTTKASVARAAVAAGARIVNDVSGTLAELAGELGVGYVAMHRRGDPTTMSQLTDYDDLVTEVLDEVLSIAERARAAGADPIWIDPGIGFAKDADQNRSLLKAVPRFARAARAQGFGLLVGLSKKRFLANGPSGQHYEVDERAEQSLAAATWVLANGATMVRAHDGLDHVRAAGLVGQTGADR